MSRAGRDKRRFSLWPSTLGGRLAMLSGIAVFVAITLSGGAAFGVAVRVITDEVDASLTAGSSKLPAGTDLDPAQICAGLEGSSVPATTSFHFELLQPDGSVCREPGLFGVVITDADRAVARTGAGGGLRDGVMSDGQEVRVRVSPLRDGYAVVAARGLGATHEILRRLRGILFFLSIAGALMAIGFGLLVARAGLRPLARLTGAVENVARTQDLDVQIEVPVAHRRDEVTRLADAFNSMISALAQARTRQAQLVADAGHELRTPLTSLRTNVDLLVRSERSGRALPPGQREALLSSLTAQLEEMSQLVRELVILAHDEPEIECSSLRLDSVLDTAVQRVSRRAGGRRIVVETEPWELVGDTRAIERALVNVLDNAVKFSPPTSTVTVRLAGGVVTVSDEGPGVAAGDRGRVFDRFWRGDDARGMPGSGLGMAIVADAVESHGGAAWVGEAPGGGALVVLSLPGQRPADAAT
ncbi:MAG TPA: HAMP domain-containing sensor histidine kinase [Dermatophilaceae bacterium]